MAYRIVAVAKEGMAVAAVVRAQKVMLVVADTIQAKIASVSYLGGKAAYVIDAGGQRLQSISTIEDRIWREGEGVSASIAPSDCCLH